MLCPLFVYFVNQYAISTSVGFLRNLFTDLFVHFFKNFGANLAQFLANLARPLIFVQAPPTSSVSAVHIVAATVTQLATQYSKTWAGSKRRAH